MASVVRRRFVSIQMSMEEAIDLMTGSDAASVREKWDRVEHAVRLYLHKKRGSTWLRERVKKIGLDLVRCAFDGVHGVTPRDLQYLLCLLVPGRARRNLPGSADTWQCAYFDGVLNDPATRAYFWTTMHGMVFGYSVELTVRCSTYLYVPYTGTNSVTAVLSRLFGFMRIHVLMTAALRGIMPAGWGEPTVDMPALRDMATEWVVRERRTCGFVWEFLKGMGVLEVRDGDDVYVVADQAMRYSVKSFLETGKACENWTRLGHAWKASAVFGLVPAVDVSRLMWPKNEETGKELYRGSNVWTEKLFATLLLGIERLEAMGVLAEAHTAMLEEMLECWTQDDNVAMCLEVR